MTHYILRGKKVVPAPNWLVWAKWFKSADRIVAQEEVCGAKVSTVFIGLDHNFFGGPPHVFETMVFGGPLDQTQERCSTWEQAEAMHAAMVVKVRRANLRVVGE